MPQITEKDLLKRMTSGASDVLGQFARRRRLGSLKLNQAGKRAGDLGLCI